MFLTLFFRRLITHTSKLLEEKQENLCVKILQTLREMLAVDTEYGEKVNVLEQFNIEAVFKVCLSTSLFSARNELVLMR